MIKLLSNKRNLIFLLLYSLPVFILSQINTFQVVIGGSEDESYPRIINAGNNEYLILNRTLSNSYGDVDIMLTKIDSAGKLLWAKNIGNDGRNYSKTIHKTNNGFIVLTWNNEYYDNVDDWCLINLDKDGEIIAHKYFGTLEIDEEVHYLVQLSDEEYVLGSTIREYSTNVKFSIMDNEMNVYNSKTYLLDYTDEGIRCAITDGDGHILFCGYHDKKPMLQGIDKNGNLAYMKYLDLPGTSELRDITSTIDGDFIIAGFTNGTGSGEYDILLIKVNTAGLISWIKTIGLSGDDKAFDIMTKPDGTYLITGETSSYSESKDIFLINIDTDGNFIRGHIYGGGGDEHYGFFDFTDDNGIIIIAETESFNTGSSDLIVIKTKEDGSSCCSRTIADIQIDNINPEVIMLNPIIITENIPETSYPFFNKIWQPEHSFICIDPLKIIGPDKVCTYSENIKYVTDPQINPSFYTWFVPDDAEIVTNLYDTAVWVNFGEVPGHIYLRSNYCDEKNIDSLYIDLSGFYPFLGNDTALCSNQQIILSPEHDYLSYLWQDSSTKPYYIADSGGIYWVEVSDLGECSGRDSIFITMVEIPEIDIGPDTIFFSGDYYELNAGPGFDSYLWSDGSTDQILRVYKEGVYWVIVSTNECTNSDTAWVYKKDCNIYISNITTPNGDGLGDYVYVLNNLAILSLDFTIYNLKGVELYHTNDVNFRWYGKVNGSILPQGVYIYKVKYICPELMAPKEKTGKIILQR